MTAHVAAAAKRDIDDIVAYLSAFGPRPTAKFLDELHAKVDLHARRPGLGRPRDDLRPGLRSFVVGQHLAFFQRTADGIAIVRVIHGSRDLPAVFGGDHPGG